MVTSCLVSCGGWQMPMFDMGDGMEAARVFGQQWCLLEGFGVLCGGKVKSVWFAWVLRVFILILSTFVLELLGHLYNSITAPVNHLLLLKVIVCAMKVYHLDICLFLTDST